MKKRYVLLLFIFIIEVYIASILNEKNIKIHSWIGNAIGVFVCILPILILLFLLGRDKKFTEKKRLCFKIAFWYVIICYLLGGVASLIY